MLGSGFKKFIFKEIKELTAGMTTVKWIIAILLSGLHFWPALAYTPDIFECTDSSDIRFGGVVSGAAFALALNPFFYRITLVGFFRKKDWKSDYYDIVTLFVAILSGAYGINSVYYFAQLGTIPDCFEGTSYPYPLFLFQLGWCFLVLFFFAIYMLVMFVLNMVRFCKLICNKNFRKRQQLASKVGNSNAMETTSRQNLDNESYFYGYIVDQARKADFTIETFDNIEIFQDVLPSEHELYKGFVQKKEANKPNLLLIAGAQAMNQIKMEQRYPLFKMNHKIPKDLMDPRTYHLLRTMFKLGPKLLNNGPCSAVVQFYYSLALRRILVRRLFYFGMTISFQIYLTVKQLHLGYEIFFMLTNLYAISFELTQVTQGWYVYFSSFEKLIEVFYRGLASYFVIGAFFNRDSWMEDNPGTGSLLLAIGYVKLGFAVDFLPFINELLIFINQGLKDVLGLLVVVIYGVFAAADSYNFILREEEMEGSTEKYSVTDVFQLVGAQAVLGFENTDGVTGKGIQYFFLILFNIILINTVIAILSESWVNVREHYKGFTNMKNIQLLLFDIDSEYTGKETYGENVQISWYAERPIDDIDYYERKRQQAKELQEEAEVVELETKAPQGYIDGSQNTSSDNSKGHLHSGTPDVIELLRKMEQRMEDRMNANASQLLEKIQQMNSFAGVKI